MPKRVFSYVLQRIEEDICRRYPVGRRYRSVRGIASHFGISLQTAHRAVTRLAELGVVRTVPKSGISILRHAHPGPVSGKRVLVVSHNPDPRFNQAFLRGIEDVAVGHGVSASLHVNSEEHTGALSFGESLYRRYVDEKCDAMVVLYFRKAELPFYYLQSQGVNLIADIALHDLPTLPAVQSDNDRHAREAAHLLHNHGKRDIVAAGFWPNDNKRYRAFRDELETLKPRALVRYIHLAAPESTGYLHLFFREFTPGKAVFSVDYAANHVLAPYFVAHGVSATPHFLVYDAEDEHFRFPGLDPVRAAAPGLRNLGRRLMQRLLVKMERGDWSQPVIEKV
ncbi:MAG: hypothetical protein A3K18_32340 [Lentisphaerae bacterium RIFOXYA12_64_32]|nr:MAG: hypothetical protein A3K18_32340 [Lentisphaerae bacterium RIFOXYA12_64_32]